MLRTFSLYISSKLNNNSIQKAILNVSINGRWCSVIQQQPADAQNVVQQAKSDVSDLVDQDVESNLPGQTVQRRRPLPKPKTLPEFVSRSQFLRNLVDFGVDLYTISTRPRDFDFITSIQSWDEDPQKVLKFLMDIGVPMDALSTIITENPYILKENVEDMEVRVNYLLSKKFTEENVSKIVAGCPKLLSMKVYDIDSRLGYFQHGFRLKGDQVRHVINLHPWLISQAEWKLKATVQALGDVLGFNIHEMKILLIFHGDIWRRPPKELENTVKYLHSELKMTHKLMVEHPRLITEPANRIQARHQFMVFMNRANFDPSKELYTPYEILAADTLEEFCERLHTTTEAYDLFVKSL